MTYPYYQESYALTGSFNYNSNPDDYHSTYHFVTSLYNDSCNISFNIYGLSSHYLNTFQVVEALHLSLMFMLDPHCLGKPFEHDKIHFPSHKSYPNLIPLMEKSYFQGAHGFKEDCLKFHTLIAEWLEQPYLASSIANNQFRSFLMLTKLGSTYEDTFTRSL